MTNKFKDDQGRWRTASLFWEKGYSEYALYTMKQEDLPNGRRSFHRLYMELSDPTEYRVATELMGGWDHWEAMQQSQWFSDYLASLRQELEVKLRSEAVVSIWEVMKAKGRSVVPAAKFFLDGDYKVKRGRGRPSKQEVKNEANTRAAAQRRLDEDMERLGLKVIDND